MDQEHGATVEDGVNSDSELWAPVRFWATVEYDGTDFAGMQIQTRAHAGADLIGLRTVQSEIERALEQVTGTKTRVVAAGRTDRGVHARGQVIGFEVQWKHGLADLQRALNAVLAADVAVLEVGPAPPGFHPRFSARARTYHYRIVNRPWRSPLERRTAWHVTRKLDLERMLESSECLVGTHDFATFGQPPGRQAKSTVRTVFRAEWRADTAGDDEGSRLAFDIEANAFLYRMVRSLVGTLVLVGWGQLSPLEFQAILEARDRSLVKQVAPPHGLCLMRVDYADLFRAREGV